MKYDDRSILFSLVKSGYNNEMDSRFNDQTSKVVFYGWLQIKNLKSDIAYNVNNPQHCKFTNEFFSVNYAGRTQVFVK